MEFRLVAVSPHPIWLLWALQCCQNTDSVAVGSDMVAVHPDLQGFRRSLKTSQITQETRIQDPPLQRCAVQPIQLVLHVTRDARPAVMKDDELEKRRLWWIPATQGTQAIPLRPACAMVTRLNHA